MRCLVTKFHQARDVCFKVFSNSTISSRLIDVIVVDNYAKWKAIYVFEHSNSRLLGVLFSNSARMARRHIGAVMMRTMGFWSSEPPLPIRKQVFFQNLIKYRCYEILHFSVALESDRPIGSSAVEPTPRWYIRTIPRCTWLREILHLIWVPLMDRSPGFLSAKNGCMEIRNERVDLTSNIVFCRCRQHNIDVLVTGRCSSIVK